MLQWPMSMLWFHVDFIHPLTTQEESHTPREDFEARTKRSHCDESENESKGGAVSARDLSSCSRRIQYARVLRQERGRMSMGQKKERQGHWLPFVAGGVAAVTSNLAVYPLTTLVTRIQSGRKDLFAGGVRGLYRGAWSSFGSVPSSAVRQFAKEFSREMLSKARYLIPGQVQVLSGVAGATAACIVVVPRELIRKQMQVGNADGTMWLTAKSIVRKRGGLGLFQGWQETLSREIPFFVINFFIVDLLKEKLEMKTGRQPNTQELFCSGALAGAVAAAVTTPFDVIQTVKMTNEAYAGRSALATAVALSTQRGPKALFTGAKLRIAAIAPLHAVWWMVYELCLQAANYRTPVYPSEPKASSGTTKGRA